MPRGFCFFSLDGVGLDPSLQVQSRSVAFGQGPPLQGDFVRRVVPRPAPTRGRGTSMYRSDEIPLQRRPSPGGMSWFRWATATAKAPHSAGAPARRSLGPQRGERRGGAGIGRKQAMDGLRSPVGARDGGIRRCARSPHCRGSPRSRKLQCSEATLPRLHPEPVDSGAFRPCRIRHPAVGRRAKKKPASPATCGLPNWWSQGRWNRACKGLICAELRDFD